MKKLMVVSDWVNDSLAVAEVRTVVQGYLENPINPDISFISSTSSTIHTSFLINELIETEERYGRPLDTIIFQASDPAIDNAGESAKIRGELFIIRLKSGIHIIGPNVGYVYSMFKSKIDAVFQYPGLTISGSFRVRDIFARVVSHLMDSKQDDLDLEEAHTNLIPQIEGYYVGHIDSFGNIITTIPESVIQEKNMYGNEVSITINNVTKTVVYTKSLFEEDQDTLVIYPGTLGKQDDTYLEISNYSELITNSTTGVDEFNNPKPGNTVIIENLL